MNIIQLSYKGKDKILMLQIILPYYTCFWE